MALVGGGLIPLDYGYSRWGIEWFFFNWFMHFGLILGGLIPLDYDSSRWGNEWRFYPISYAYNISFNRLWNLWARFLQKDLPLSENISNWKSSNECKFSINALTILNVKGRGKYRIHSGGHSQSDSVNMSNHVLTILNVKARRFMKLSYQNQTIIWKGENSNSNPGAKPNLGWGVDRPKAKKPRILNK